MRLLLDSRRLSRGVVLWKYGTKDIFFLCLLGVFGAPCSVSQWVNQSDITQRLMGEEYDM